MEESSRAREAEARERDEREGLICGKKLHIDGKGNYYLDTPMVGGVMRMDSKGRISFVKESRR
jgi:hypothetical protein